MSGTPQPFWMRPLCEVLDSISSSKSGLTAPEAAARLKRFGRNEVVATRAPRLVELVFLRLREPLALLLLGAAALSGIAGDAASFVIILTMVIIGVALDVVQEHRAHKAAAALKARVALRETVLRDGQEVSIPSAEIVPGDVVVLSTGDVAPADGRVLEAEGLTLDEATLTGEAYPAVKTAEEDLRDRPLSESGNAIFAGASVVSGRGKLMVVATGAQTEFGHIAKAVQAQGPQSALERGTQAFGLLVVRLTMVLALIVVTAHMALGRPFLPSLMFALAIAVGLTPELLPMVVAVTLSRGSIRLAKGGVIVKRLSAVHDLGAMTVLCTDKTGTLTEAEIKLAHAVTADGQDSEAVSELARLNARLARGFASPMDAALAALGPIDPEWRATAEAPFDFVRRRVSVLAGRGAERLMICKGAPEETIGICAFVGLPGGLQRALSAEDRRALLGQVASFGAAGERALAVAWKAAPPDQQHCDVVDEHDLVFAGFVTFMDPPKASAGAAIASLKALGVAVKVVTGDSLAVTRRVCEQINFAPHGALEGRDIDRLSDAGLAAIVAQTDLFCRATPVQKNRIIAALRRRGAIIGYLGDGVNDAPSLHDAHVGISVSGAVDVAREAADLILLAPDLNILAAGVREGRRTLANIMKYLMMAASSNFGNMVSMTAAALFLPFLPMTATQILLNNLLYDASGTTLPLDRVDEDAVSAPRSWDMNQLIRFMLALGPVSSIFDGLTFCALLFLFHASPAVFQTAWFVESLATQTLVIFVIRTSGLPWRSRPHPAVAASAAAACALGFVIPFTPLGAWFGFVPLPGDVLLAIILLAAAYLVCAEGAKRLLMRFELRLREKSARATSGMLRRAGVTGHRDDQINLSAATGSTAYRVTGPGAQEEAS